MKSETRKKTEQRWETYVSKTENDVHSRQAYKIVNDLNKAERDEIHLNAIKNKEWKYFYGKLWTKKRNVYVG
jgi:hypothetical protein